FTIIELIVASAIICVLVGLLLPALIAARESARCLQCKSNLREIGLAIQQHHDALKRLPGAWKLVSKTSGYGWSVPVLPFLDQSNLDKAINCPLPLSASQNGPARTADLPIMKCPSDISDPLFQLFAATTEHPGHLIKPGKSAPLPGG